MPRIRREESGTGIYHVMLRGINRQDIFDEPGSKNHRDRFLIPRTIELMGTVPVSIIQQRKR